MRVSFSSLACLVTLVAFGSAGLADEISKEALRKLLKENPEIILDVLREHPIELFKLMNEAAQQARAQREKEEFEEAFRNPKQPKITAATRIRGNTAAKYTLVEYSDFQCPYCGRSFPVVEALRKKYGKELRFIYKHLPLDFHPQAMPAALYMEAIALQSPEKAWEFHDILFQNQDKLGEKFFHETAKKFGLDLTRLARDVRSEKVKATVEADIQEAHELGFSGTPAFLLNGIPIKGAYPIEHFESVMKRLSN